MKRKKFQPCLRPLAEKTLDLVTVRDSDTVLDVACGTGILSRILKAQNPNLKRIAGCDINPGMIEVARKLTISKPSEYEWHIADVANMPFDDDLFSLCFCQQGLQFFPDKTAALLEFNRVLKSDGRIVLSVWSEISPFFNLLASSLAKHVNSSVAERSLAPFSFRDRTK